MTRDMKTKAKTVVDDETDWDPRKNDLKGFDDGTNKERAPRELAPIRQSRPLSSAPPVPAPAPAPAPALAPAPAPATAATQPQPTKLFIPKRELTILPIVSNAMVGTLTKQGWPFAYEGAVQKYTGNDYGKYQAVVRRQLQPASNNSISKGVNPEHQLYQPINAEFGTGYFDYGEKDWERLALELNGYINLCPLPESITVYRGTRDVPFVKSAFTKGELRYMSSYLDSQLQVGQAVPLTGFTSTSLSPSFAIMVATGGSAEAAYKVLSTPGKGEFMSAGTLLQFELPKGYPGLYYEGMGEFELILPYSVTSGPYKAKMPFWLVAKRDKIRVLIQRPKEEMFPTQWTWGESHKFVTITRVILRPWMRKIVKF